MTFTMHTRNDSEYNHDFKNDEFADKYIFKHKRNGYFVEIGACDGISSSQCYFFEKNLDWDGIAIEPQKRFNNQMLKNRKKPFFKCLGNKNGIVNFTESTDYGLSGITEIQNNHEQNHESYKTEWRNPGFISYDVEMTTLLNVLDEYNSPHIIDYVGMDCEGSEYNILEHYFNNNTKYLVKFFCVEVGRLDIVELIKKNDYIEIINPLLPEYNGQTVTWERYFIHKSEINNIDNELIRDKLE